MTKYVKLALGAGVVWLLFFRGKPGGALAPGEVPPEKAVVKNPTGVVRGAA